MCENCSSSSDEHFHLEFLNFMSLFDFNLYDLLEYSDVMPSEEELKKMGMTWNNYIEKHRDELREKKRIKQEQQREWLAQHPAVAEYYSQFAENTPQEPITSKQNTVVVSSNQESVVPAPKQVKSPEQVSLMDEEEPHMSMESEDSVTEEELDGPIVMDLIDGTEKINPQSPQFDLREWMKDQEESENPKGFSDMTYCIYTIYFLIQYIKKANNKLTFHIRIGDRVESHTFHLVVGSIQIEVTGLISPRLAKLVAQFNSLSQSDDSSQSDESFPPSWYDPSKTDDSPTQFYMWCNMLYKIAREVGFQINTAIPQRHLGRPRKNSLTMNNRLISCSYDGKTYEESTILQTGSQLLEEDMGWKKEDPSK